jgi:hypothetical protein
MPAFKVGVSVAYFCEADLLYEPAKEFRCYTFDNVEDEESDRN